MDLEIEDVAQLLNVSINEVTQWVEKGDVPAYRIHDTYRFNRVEIEDWVLEQKRSEAPDHLLEGKTAQPGNLQFALFRAIHRGAVLHNIAGTTKEEVIRNTVDQLTSQLDIDGEAVSDLLMEREKLQSTGINGGFAVPHTRDFLLKDPFDAVAVVFLDEPIEYDALDGQPVHTLFFLFAADDKRHLHLLAKIAHLLSDQEAEELLNRKPTKQALLKYIRRWEAGLAK